MNSLKIALLSSALLVPLMALPAIAATAGVTAAVNPAATGTPAGGAARTIVLGGDILTDEKIDTSGEGLVQVLLADGTTFTVGPNSSLVIDKFVYDPAANTAQVTASLARGVFRFIGGRTSKTDGGVVLNTPVGTVGIRGAVVDLNFSPGGKTQAQIDLLFGKEVTLKPPGGTPQKVYSAGYSIVIGADNKPSIVKTPPGSATGIQQALAGKPGTHGGSKAPPTDDAVGNSGVPKSNSGQTPPFDIGTPDPGAIELATIIFDNEKPIPPGTEPQNPPPTDVQQHTVHGFSTAMSDIVVVGYELNESDAGIVWQSQLLSQTTFNLDNQFNVLGGAFEDIRSPYNNDDVGSFAFGNMPGAPSVSATRTSGGDVHHFPVSSLTSEVTVDVGHACVACEFMRWGTWEIGFDINETNPTPYSEHAHFLGTWVVGDIPTDSAFDAYTANHDGASAYYEGTVLASVYNGSSTYLAGGDLQMGYNFGVHSVGDVSITSFDGTNHFDHMYVTGAAHGPGFSGSGSDQNETATYSINGSFAQNGADVAAGVMGNFAVDTEDGGGTYRAAGVFVGARNTAP